MLGVSSFLRSGLVLRSADAPDGGFGLLVSGAGLEMGLVFEDWHLRTRGDMIVLSLARQLPETIVLACPGRELDEVVLHPLLSGRGHVIVSAEQRYGTETALTMRAERVAWRVPWAPGARAFEAA